MVLKTPVENAPRTRIEKHLSWSSDIPPAARFPLHRSRPAEYQPNQQPDTVCAESGAGEARRRVGRTRAANERSPRSRALAMQSSAPAPGAQSTVRWATEDSISQCPFLQMTCTAENPHADGSAAPGARPSRQTRHSDPPATPRTHDNWMAARQTSRRQQTAPPQPRCSKDVTTHQHRPRARPGRPCPAPACSGQPQSGRRGFSPAF